MLVIYVNSASALGGQELRIVTEPTIVEDFVEMPGMPYSEAGDDVKAKLAMGFSPASMGQAPADDE